MIISNYIVQYNSTLITKHKWITHIYLLHWCSCFVCFLLAQRLLQLSLIYTDAEYSKYLRFMVPLLCGNKNLITVHYWMLILLLVLNFRNHTAAFKTHIHCPRWKSSCLSQGKHHPPGQAPWVSESRGIVKRLPYHPRGTVSKLKAHAISEQRI